MRTRRQCIIIAGSATTALAGCLDVLDDSEESEEANIINVTDTDTVTDDMGNQAVTVTVTAPEEPVETNVTATLYRDGTEVRTVVEPEEPSGEFAVTLERLYVEFDDYDIAVTPSDELPEQSGTVEVTGTDLTAVEGRGEMVVEFSPPDENELRVGTTLYFFDPSVGTVPIRSITEPVSLDGGDTRQSHRMPVRNPRGIDDYDVWVRTDSS